MLTVSTFSGNLSYKLLGKLMAKQKKTYHHGDLRNTLLVAAEQLLEQNGVGTLSLRAVAKAAGVSHAAPYRHFEDKNALLSGLAVVGFGRLADAMDRCVEENPDNPQQQLLASFHAYVQLATEHSQMTNLIFGGIVTTEDCGADLMETSERAFNGLTRIIQNGQAAGLYIKKDTIELAMFVWSLAHGFSMLLSAGHLSEMADNEAAVGQTVRQLSEMALRGMTL